MAIKSAKSPSGKGGKTASAGSASIAIASVAPAAGSEVHDFASAKRTGATYEPRYLKREPDIVGVDVDDLREFKDEGVEVFFQFTLGEFLAAGAFWLGIERIVTADVWYKDAVFWVCVVAFISGVAIGIFGFLQLKRRQSRINRIINTATPMQAKTAGT